MHFGTKNQGNEISQQRRKMRLEAICYYTSHVVKDSIKPVTAAPATQAPTTLAPTVAPTLPPTTAAPSTGSPTLTPSQSPTLSAAPTDTRLVEINVKWKLELDTKMPNNRDATDEEYQQFANTTSAWLTETMRQAYSNDASLNYETQTTEFVSSEYNEDPAAPGMTVLMKSAFVFRGTQPTPRSVFEVLDSQDLKPFVEQRLWIPDGTANPWIFDNVLKLTLSSAR